ncbi:hypothetical protein HY637_04455 [Candidatus Woesearchaeota archaeon]|nr:hypothetical protein [Candidatus Woesearchaeota archaeon]
MDDDIDWKVYLKKIGLFFLFAIIGIIIFGAISVFIRYSWVLLKISFLIYILLLILILTKYSKKLLICAFLSVLIYFLIMIFPFKVCSFTEPGIHATTQVCRCNGIEKHLFGLYAGFDDSQCIGHITEYICYKDDFSAYDVEKNNYENIKSNVTYQQTPCS